jgi:DNA-directed RNA polymerase specialized sigma24 family protein
MTDPAVSFEPHRRRRRGLAYRMLGSVSEAEDAVQDAYRAIYAVSNPEKVSHLVRPA